MNARRITTALALVLLFMDAERATASDIKWADQFGNSVFVAGFQTKADASGVYVAGLINPVDIFLRKYDFNGQVLWARRLGTTTEDFLSGLATDSSGIYLTGATLGALAGQLPDGSFNAFVRKYSVNGDVIWTSQFGTSALDSPIDGGGAIGAGGNGIASHSTGIYVAGRTLGAFPGEPAGAGQDFFVAKLDPDSGNMLWVRQFGVRGIEAAMQGGIGADDTGVYVATNHFPTNPLLGFSMLRKYDFDGNLVWAQQHSSGTLGACGSFVWNLAVHAGALFVVSQEAEGFVMDVPDSCQVGPRRTNVVGGLRAYDSGGNLLWTRKIKGGAPTSGGGFTGAKTVWASEAGVFVAANLTGSFPGYLPAGPRMDHADFTGAENGSPFFDSLDAYVRMYNSNGDVIWTRQFGSSVFDIALSLGTDTDSVYATGHTNGVVAAGETFSGGFSDAFIIRFATNLTSLSGLLQLLVGQIETLKDNARLLPGEFTALIQNLEAALGAIDRANPAAARQALESFIQQVNVLTGRGALSAPEGAALITAANGVISKL